MKTLLTQAGVNVLGCVVNKQRRSRHDTSYSYYYYYRHAGQNGEGKDSVASSADSANGFDAAKHMVEQVLHEGRKGRRQKDGE